MSLKPQDTVLALKFCSLRNREDAAGVRAIADSLGISASEVSKGSRRLVTSRLAVERQGGIFPEAGALLEWLCYGVRFAYPLESIGYGRGMPTSWNCPLLDTEMVPPSPPLAWSDSGGSVEGVLVSPIHPSVVLASAKDEWLYQALALVDAIRGGKPRELAIARKHLTELLRRSW